MYGINYQQSVYMLVVYTVNMFKNKIDKYLVKEEMKRYKSRRQYLKRI